MQSTVIVPLLDQHSHSNNLDDNLGEDAPETDRATRPHRRRRSTLARRILAINVLALAIPVLGLLYLDEYQDNLIAAELGSLRTQASLFAGAIGTASAVSTPADTESLNADLARNLVRRLVDISKNRARLFDQYGTMIADSYRLAGPGGQIEIATLAEPDTRPVILRWPEEAYNWLLGKTRGEGNYPPYRETANPIASDFAEVTQALNGETAAMVRVSQSGKLVLVVAVPVQRYRQVLGALMLTAPGDSIDAAVLNVRLNILAVFAIALGITILLSLYLAGTIARPIRRLALAADQLRHGQGRQGAIPDFTRRGDEIGDLSAALRSMTAALWARMDAIERFAADVAHEIKNPLTSLRSAVETVSRIDDPTQRERLMAIILDDIQRLNRLITDISDASRLDAELSRARFKPVDLRALLSMLSDVHGATRGTEIPRLVLSVEPSRKSFMVRGIEGRLTQILRNLIANATSFSPTGSDIALKLGREGPWIEISIADHGPGIPPDKLETIFERFYTERPRSEKFGQHSGLGLSISRQIAEAHGGTLVAENLTDPQGHIVGARFVLKLPGS